jgi:hypothetical protein
METLDESGIAPELHKNCTIDQNQSCDGGSQSHKSLAFRGIRKARGRSRTVDNSITNAVLYQLSYAGIHKLTDATPCFRQPGVSGNILINFTVDFLTFFSWSVKFLFSFTGAVDGFLQSLQ